jgi:hypothetical protein
LAPEEITERIRNALFDCPDVTDEEKELFPEVLRRFDEAWKNRLKPPEMRRRGKRTEKPQTELVGESTNLFDTWLAGSHSSLLYQIEKQKTAPGGVIDRRIVRAALVEDAWNSYRVLSKCMKAAMLNFVELLPEPLTSFEMHVFRRVYTPRRWLGGLTLAQMQERLPLLAPIGRQLIKPANNSNGVRMMYRMLQWYSQMAYNLRQLNREKQRRRRRRH